MKLYDVMIHECVHWLPTPRPRSHALTTIYTNTPHKTNTALLGFAEFDQPATIAKNVGVSFIFYSIFFALGFVGLAYFHKERR